MLNTPRDTELQQFIAASGWGAAEIASLAGDASNRRYSRLHHPKLGRAVLMDAPPNRGEDVRPFLKVTEILTQAGLSAPRILAQDTEIGALLIEDLGDAIYARVIENDASLERPLYEAAIDVLLHLHQRPIPEGLPDYTGARMAEASALAAIWYAGQGDSDHPFTAELQALMDQTLAQLPQTDLAMAQRDYHAENLLWLPQRQGPARVGLLDYQDAALAHPAYDLVSLLEDARRDVSPELVPDLIARYVAGTKQDPTDFAHAYAVMGAQRNLRILGVFARLSLAYGKAHYVDLIPRVWAHLQSDLAHPNLAELRAAILDNLPSPSPALLAELKAKCATIPLA